MAWTLFMGTLVGQPSDFNLHPGTATDMLARAVQEVYEGKREVRKLNDGVFVECGSGAASGYWVQFYTDGRIEIGEPAA